VTIDKIVDFNYFFLIKSGNSNSNHRFEGSKRVIINQVDGLSETSAYVIDNCESNKSFPIHHLLMTAAECNLLELTGGV